MLIQSAFDIHFELASTTPMIAMLHLHPSVQDAIRTGDELRIESEVAGTSAGFGTCINPDEFSDSFGNRCSRFTAPAGKVRLSGMNIVELNDALDPDPEGAQQSPIEELPHGVLQFLLASRYCEVDRFVSVANDLFGGIAPGWARAAAIRDWVHEKVSFNYMTARPTKTAMDVYTERIGVCRDFQHLAVTLSRCVNIPARYVTGYLGDVRHPYSGAGDFSAWYEVWLDGRWWAMDARHNEPRYGRVLMATGRDAADVAITTSFGNAELKHFWVESNEVNSLARGATICCAEVAS
jgi:transglutaminase-like putative cysteine protease